MKAVAGRAGPRRRRAPDRAVALLQRAPAHHLRRHDAAGRPRRERAAADGAGHRQLPHPARRGGRRRAEDAGHGARRSADRAGAVETATAQPAVAAGGRAAGGHRERRRRPPGARRRRPIAPFMEHGRHRRPASCAAPGSRSTASAASPSTRTTIRAHGKDERILVKSFSEGLVFAYQLGEDNRHPSTGLGALTRAPRVSVRSDT